MNKHENNINVMMELRGFEYKGENIFVNANNHIVYINYIDDKSKAEGSILNIKNFLEAQRNNVKIKHVIIYYYGKDDKISVDKMNEYITMLLFTMSDIFYFELFLERDFDVNPVYNAYAPEEITIYPPGSYQSNVLYDSMSRFCTIDNNGNLNTNRILKSDPLVKYLNLDSGTILVTKSDKGYKSRISNMSMKILVVVNEIQEEYSLHNLYVPPERRCNCTNYNSLI